MRKAHNLARKVSLASELSAHMLAFLGRPDRQQESSSMASALLTLKIAPNGPVFDLPIYVARDAGLFAKAGLEIAFQAKYQDRTPSEKDAFARLKEQLFEQGKADVYNLCEWAGIDRSERSTRGSQILALRPAVAAQAIISFDDAIQEPRDLAGVPIGINQLTGSHYTTLQLLEGAIPREQIIVEHAGSPENRYKALREGKYRAVTVMEPFISLALKEGAHLVDVTFYRGAEVITPDLSEELRAGYIAAVNGASDLINADFDRYKHHILAHAGDVGASLQPHELGRQFIRYTHVRTFEAERFRYTYEWMRSWGLTEGASTHGAIVAPALAPRAIVAA
jgi:NitT/TauT family transport system substrate-binding protein